MNRNGNRTTWSKGDWDVAWSATHQHYKVWYKSKLFAVKHRFADVEQYIR